MTYSVRKCLKLIKEKEEEIQAIRSNIENEKLTHKMLIETKEKELEESMMDLDKLENITFSISKNELLSELASLLRIPVNQLYCEYDTNVLADGKYLSIAELMVFKDDEPELYIEIYDIFAKNKATSKFYFSLAIPLDLHQKQLDGSLLHEHCNVETIENGIKHKKYFSVLNVDEDFDILLNFKFKFLKEEKYEDERILKEAVVNCLEKKLNITKTIKK